MSEARAEPSGLQPSLDLGARLRAQRLSTGMSLREMARRLKRSPSAISQFETGKARPSVSTLFEMVELLGTSIDTLLGTDEPGTGAGEFGAGEPNLAGPQTGSFDSSDRSSGGHGGGLQVGGKAGVDDSGPGGPGTDGLAARWSIGNKADQQLSTAQSAVSRPAAGPRGASGHGASGHGASGRRAGDQHADADPPAATGGVLDMPNRVILERAADHPCIELENTVQWTRLSRSMSGVEFLLVTYPPGAWSSGTDGRFMHHAGHEFAYLLSGLLTVEISFDSHLDSYEVRAGDSITFPAAMAHRLGNRSTAPATAIWCIFAAGGGSSLHKNGVRVSPASPAAMPGDPPGIPPEGPP
jgi:uncharacterized cupin superfamily protein/DNA-binding XRE family transcriptional regulator